MDLREYLFRKRMTIPCLAKMLDCSRQQIGLVKAGRPVSKKFARQIERVTNGEVTAQEVVTKATVIPLPVPEPQHDDDDGELKEKQA